MKGSLHQSCILARPAIIPAKILYPSAMWPSGWVPPSPPPQVPQGNQQQPQQGIPNGPHAANGGAAPAGMEAQGGYPLFGLGQQAPPGLYGYGGVPTPNPAPIILSEHEAYAYRQLFIALDEQRKNQALLQMVRAFTDGGGPYPSHYPFYNYNAAAPATPSPNARYEPPN